MSEVKTCPTCGTEYPISERFCPRDGTALRSANPNADLVGSIVHEKFHIIKKLGEGGMGAVYLAEHVKMGRKMALKVMSPSMHQDADAIARFNREAKNASQINHPNVCGIYDFGETPEGMIYLAMEFIEGSSLSGIIEKNGALTPARAASIIHQTADALQVAHDYGIVHRDLKPDNIMIAQARDKSDLVKVVDFGIAKASSSDAQKVTKTGLVVGTPEYMSPEQLSGDKLDGRSDIYSLGLVAFNCLTGKLPFAGNSAQEAMIARLVETPKTLAEVAPEKAWPEELEDVMRKALARDVTERYQNAAQFGRDLSKAVENMPHTMIAEVGTQVIGAGAAVAAAAAKTAAAPAVPKTRLAPKSATPSAPEPAAPAPAPAQKSSMPMIAAAVAVIVIGGGGFAAYKAGMFGPSTATPPAAGSDTSSQANGTKTDPAATSTQNSQTSGAANTQKLNGPITPNPQTTNGKSAGPVAPPGNPGGAPAEENFDDKLSAWREWTDGTKGEAVVTRTVSEINATLPRMNGIPKARAYYFLAIAYGLQQREEAACDALKKGRDVPGTNEASIAALFKDMGCK
jgi:serine/threonine protein kinase